MKSDLKKGQILESDFEILDVIELAEFFNVTVGQMVGTEQL